MKKERLLMNIAMLLGAIGSIRTGAIGTFSIFSIFFVFLTGCAVPSAPTYQSTYDFGPGPMVVQPTNRLAALPALALAEVDASAALDSTAVLYRLAYADARQLQPYAQARWSMAPAQLLRQRLREQLGLRRAMLNPGEAGAGVSPAVSAPALLRIELEEFSQVFMTSASSVGLLRLRATVLQGSPQGERLVAQRSVIVQRPAPSADAPGGVQALTAAADGAVEEIEQWLQQLR